MKKNIENYYYPYKSDVLVGINDSIVLEIECKAYTENAMMKRILVDCILIKKNISRTKFLLITIRKSIGW